MAMKRRALLASFLAAPVAVRFRPAALPPLPIELDEGVFLHVDREVLVQAIKDRLLSDDWALEADYGSSVRELLRIEWVLP